MGEIEAVVVSGKEINILLVHILFEFFNCLNVVCLHSKVEGMHAVGAAFEVEVEQLQIILYYMLFTNFLNFTNVFNV